MLTWCIWNVQIYCIYGLQKCALPTLSSGSWAESTPGMGSTLMIGFSVALQRLGLKVLNQTFPPASQNDKAYIWYNSFQYLYLKEAKTKDLRWFILIETLQTSEQVNLANPKFVENITISTSYLATIWLWWGKKWERSTALPYSWCTLPLTALFIISFFFTICSKMFIHLWKLCHSVYYCYTAFTKNTHDHREWK